MPKLSKTQQEVLGRMSRVVPGSAYSLRARLPTLRKLVQLGYAKDVTPFGPGGMFSPQTHHKFVLTPEGEKQVPA